PPPVPRTVRMKSPGAAKRPAWICRVLVAPVVGSGVKLCPIPASGDARRTPSRDKSALAVNPALRVRVTGTDVGESPGKSTTSDSESESRNRWTVRLSVAVLITLPPCACTVSVYLPGGTLPATVSVMVLLLPVVEGGLKLPMTPVLGEMSLKVTE